MFFNPATRLGHCLIAILSCCFYFFSLRASAQTEEIGVFVSPNNCVALTKGRECYTRANITWRTRVSGMYCITIDTDLTPVKCWQDARRGEFVYEMSSSQNVTITLHRPNTNTLIGTAVIEVSWLYAGDNRKRRWRLF
ncbi:DUF3019 domain-containing protein [Alteromonas oceanisediminis]|uniref:DUF3019 domain-containing protein n=1 Tax=Alteromonas oceanisediminis TaxID=2836180 RepID=UPI001BDA50AE|nr:DUF3019 domain-containing protein [Alteromonas oceanisediminis]MBT0586135.1 DUF3019 domain-containing protein [Alteromonas oceanisediminis]